MSVTASANGQIDLIDSAAGTNQLVKLFSGLSVVGTVSEVVNNLLIGASPQSITLPISPIQFMYLKNLHAVNFIEVTWTPVSGSSTAILLLEPGGFIIWGNPVTGGGIMALSLQASATSTPVEMVLLG